MKFGVREIANVVFRAKSNVTIGNKPFKAGQPVLYIDTAKTSTLEGAATTVYAQGGRGNTRLVAWEGEKTLTFTVEDALISPVGLSVLTGAGLIKPEAATVNVHMTTMANIDSNGQINLEDAVGNNEICTSAPLFVMAVDGSGSLTGETYALKDGVGTDKGIDQSAIPEDGSVRKTFLNVKDEIKDKNVLVDYYILKSGADVSEIQIDAENFAGYYYVEADTLFRRQEDGVDMPANITLPNVKIQSNFTFSMASTGDPSTFTFTMDAMPGYTYFDRKKKVLCVIQVIDDAKESTVTWSSVMDHDAANFHGNKENNDFEDNFVAQG